MLARGRKLWYSKTEGKINQTPARKNEKHYLPARRKNRL